MTAPRVEIYTTRFCPYCIAAKRLLKQKDIAFTEYDVTFQPEERAEMTGRAGRRTVPQIFIDDRPIGGCDDLYALEKSGELERMLAA